MTLYAWNQAKACDPLLEHINWEVHHTDFMQGAVAYSNYVSPQLICAQHVFWVTQVCWDREGM